MSFKVITTDKAPSAIGPYSQATQQGPYIFLSGQVALDPKTMQLVATDLCSQARQCFRNLSAVAAAANASLANIVKLNIYLTDLTHFASVNEVMMEFFAPPYPARATVGVAQLPLKALIEIDGIILI